MLPWSSVLIAKNEAKTLPRLLNSLKEFQAKTGTVYVVDTGSTDGTPEIARDLGCEVFEVGDKFQTTIDKDLAEKINAHFGEQIVKEGEKLFDFSAARNYAASLAKTDMVCMPDPDEIFTKYDLQKIQEIIESGVEQLEYNFVFAHDQFGNEAIKFLHSKFYNKKKLHWEGIVHEVLQGEAKRQWLPEDIIKLEHFQNPETNRGGYLTGLALDCFQHPEKDRQSHYLGREFMYKGFYKAAIKELQRHVDMKKWPQERAQSLNFIGECYDRLGDKENAVASWHKAFEIDGSRRESLLRLAQFYFNHQDWQKVVCYAKAALEIPYYAFYANNACDYTYVPHELIYQAKLWLGDRDGAKEHFEKAFEYSPQDSKNLFHTRYFYGLPSVSIILPTLQREAGLQRCLQSIEQLNYPADLIQTIVIEDSPRIGVPKRVAEGLEKSSGELIVFASNDIEFDPDSLILAVLESKNKGLVAFNTGEVSEDEGNICEHFLIRKNLIEKIGGEIFDTEFFHCGVDNLLWAKAKKLGEAIRCEKAKINHYHFSKGTAEFDEVNAIGWNEENVKHDRELLKKKLELLNA